MYALLFAAHGLSVTQISSLFVVWSAVGFLAEVPSGALADIAPRRYLLAAAPVMTGTAFALWLLLPGYPAFAAGFVLWGLAGSLTSGTVEALVHTELSRRDAQDRYASVMGRARALGVGATGAATLAAVPVMSWGGYPAVATASVAACALCCAAALMLPENRTATTQEPTDDDESYVAVLRIGLAEVRTDREILRTVALVIVVASFWGVLDEYVPLLLADASVAPATIPVVLALVWAGVSVGGLVAGAAAALPAVGFGSLVALAGIAIGCGALVHGPLGWTCLGVGFGICQAATVIADARLQARISSASRATVTSIAGLGTDVATTATYPIYALVCAVSSHSTAFVAFAVPYVLIGGVVVLTRFE
nr:MFS transporter [Gordonia asplenii]